MARVTEQDAYKFYMGLGPLSNSSRYYGKDNFFWQQLVEHPNYDSFWQKRSILPHLKNVHTNVMTVGGWFDAEDLYGPLETYKGIEASADGRYNTLVFGPWDHGAWAREVERNAVGNYYFGDSISDFFQREIESKFFSQHRANKSKGITHPMGCSLESSCLSLKSSVLEQPA